MFIRRFLFATAVATVMAPAAVSAQDAFLSEVVILPYNFCPRGFLEANGSILSISQNTALFSLLGTTYGGNGITTFALPDLRGRTITHFGQGPGLSERFLGETSGSTSVTLITANLPPHSHNAAVRANIQSGLVNNPTGNSIARTIEGKPFYSSGVPDVDMRAGNVTVAPSGAGQPVQKQSPYLAMRNCIAIQGAFPPRNF